MGLRVVVLADRAVALAGLGTQGPWRAGARGSLFAWAGGRLLGASRWAWRCAPAAAAVWTAERAPGRPVLHSSGCLACHPYHDGLLGGGPSPGYDARRRRPASFGGGTSPAASTAPWRHLPLLRQATASSYETLEPEACAARRWSAGRPLAAASISTCPRGANRYQSAAAGSGTSRRRWFHPPGLGFLARTARTSNANRGSGDGQRIFCHKPGRSPVYDWERARILHPGGEVGIASRPATPGPLPRRPGPPKKKTAIPVAPRLASPSPPSRTPTSFPPPGSRPPARCRREKEKKKKRRRKEKEKKKKKRRMVGH